MTEFQTAFLRDLQARGYIHQVTDAAALDQALGAGPVAAYIGFDCTARSLHIGSLIQIMLLRRLQQAGHRPIVLLGGATSRIGDPSGKDASRNLIDEATIADNLAGIRRNFERFLTFGDGRRDAIIVNNDDWMRGESYVDFLRKVGPHFTINRMLSFDSVRLRLDREQPLSFLEFNYMILQAYDFLELSRRHDCRLQMGGSDQWGNIVNGMELVRRLDGKTVFGLTTPLLTTADGKKMGKTEAGAVWLAEDMLAPYDYWQYWRNCDDRDVGRFLRLFTDLPLSEIAALEQLDGSAINDAKIRLANEATRLCHGADAAADAAASARKTFEEGGTGTALPQIDATPAELTPPGAVVNLLVKAGLAASRKAARRLIEQGGVRLDGTAVRDEIDANQRLHALAGNGAIKLSAGRKKHVNIVIKQ